MLLAVNINNTHVKLGLYADDAGDDARPLQLWRVATDRARTADEWWVQLATLLTTGGYAPDRITAAVIASVVPPVTGQWRVVCERHLRIAPQVADTANSSVRIGTDRPSENGADRVMNVLGGYARYGGPLIIVDLGTATTFDCVNAAGDLIGGAISPGLMLSFEALASRAALLFTVELAHPPHAIGTNTVDQLNSGVVLGYTSLVEGLCARLAREMDAAEGVPRIIGTGGLAPLIAGGTDLFAAVDDDLTLYGMYLLHRRG